METHRDGDTMGWGHIGMGTQIPFVRRGEGAYKLYQTLHCHHQNYFSIQMRNADSHFDASVTAAKNTTARSQNTVARLSDFETLLTLNGL